MTNDTPAWPDDDGCSNHWLKCPRGHLVFAQWEGPTGEWLPHDQPDYMIETCAMIAAGYTYLGPCLTPSEVAAREQAAAVAMREATARMASIWGRDLFGDADDYKREWNDACDEVGSSIRALPIETGALDAMLAHAREEGAKAERKACAAVCEMQADYWVSDEIYEGTHDDMRSDGARGCVRAIRARGNT